MMAHKKLLKLQSGQRAEVNILLGSLHADECGDHTSESSRQAFQRDMAQTYYALCQVCDAMEHHGHPPVTNTSNIADHSVLNFDGIASPMLTIYIRYFN